MISTTFCTVLPVSSNGSDTPQLGSRVIKICPSTDHNTNLIIRKTKFSTQEIFVFSSPFSCYCSPFTNRTVSNISTFEVNSILSADSTGGSMYVNHIGIRMTYTKVGGDLTLACTLHEIGTLRPGLIRVAPLFSSRESPQRNLIV